MIRTWLKEGELNVVEYEAEKMNYCEPEQGPVLGEEDDGIQESHIYETNEFSMNVDIEIEDEHKEKIKEIESNLFPKGSVKPQVKHSNLVF